MYHTQGLIFEKISSASLDQHMARQRRAFSQKVSVLIILL